MGHLYMSNMTALQQHVAFFDRNKDGIIYPWETYQGFQAIGFNMTISLLAASVINMALSYATSHSLIPSSSFPIYVDNIQKGKHGSDSDVYDSEGVLFLPSLMPSSPNMPAHILTDSHMQRCRPCLRAIEM
jgi:peroxygenase